MNNNVNDINLSNQNQMLNERGEGNISNLCERKQKEIDFHNQVEEVRLNRSEEYESIYPNSAFYSITESSREYVRSLLKNSRGLKMLDYCCGQGGWATTVAKQFGIHVTGIDISEGRVEAAKRLAIKEGVADLCEFYVMDAENLTFPNDSFDLAICSGILHHLDLDAAYKQLSRVIRKDGKVIAVEALMHNPIFQLYRRMTPKYRTEYETEHILTRQKILGSKKYFNNLNTRFFHLTALAAVPFRKRPILFRPILFGLNCFDRVVLNIPLLKWWAWQCVFIMTKPKK
jgi:ubiquinone/menaquinone biosynthesis C-methylase UbiE